MSTITNLKLIVRGFLSADCDFELRADRHPTSDEWDLIFETLAISRRQSDRKKYVAQLEPDPIDPSRVAPETAPSTADKTSVEAKEKGQSGGNE
jgi:hypothetical protein